MMIMMTQWRLSVLMFALLVAEDAHAQQPPHIVFIIADDLGWNDVSFHGSDQILTPNLDALASKGVVLQHYYSEAVCTPARTALLTGKYPMRLGMHGTPLFNSEDRGIPLTERLLPSYLKELGYSTHLVGKWHVGMSREDYLPTRRGYDSHFGMRGGFIDYYTYNKVENWPNGREMFGLDLFDGLVPQYNERRYIVDVLTDRAIDIIDQHNASTPLFLHVTHNAPHAGNAGGALQPPLRGNISNGHIAHSDRRLYADVVTSLDNSVGEIVQALADKKILDNTIIIFVSDNGAPTVGMFRNWGNNLPFRGKKETPWEGAVRVPAFIWHRNMTPKVWQGLMHITDWLPTLAQAAGGTIDREIDGISQWDPLLSGQNSNRKEVMIAVGDQPTNTYAAFRAGDYKIIVGNVTGMSNGYYGAEFLATKGQQPDYWNMIRSCQTVKAFHTVGLKLNVLEVQAMRQAATLRQLESRRDSTLCEPTLERACVFNVRRDPMEAYNLWDKAKSITKILSSRLRALWASQVKRGSTINLQSEADPTNFNYTWMPWIRSMDEEEYTNTNLLTYSVDPSLDSARSSNDNVYYTFGEPNTSRPKNNGNTVAQIVDCTGTEGVRHFLCVLRSVF